MSSNKQDQEEKEYKSTNKPSRQLTQAEIAQLYSNFSKMKESKEFWENFALTEMIVLRELIECSEKPNADYTEVVAKAKCIKSLYPLFFGVKDTNKKAKCKTSM